MKFSRYLPLAALLSCLLGGCGGGGGGTTSGSVALSEETVTDNVPESPPSPPVQELSDLNFRNLEQAASTNAVLSQESILQLGFLSRTILTAPGQKLLTGNLECEGGGHRKYQLNGNSKIEQGQDFEVIFSSCFVPELNAVITGTIGFSVISLDTASTEITALVTIDDLLVENDEPLELNASYTFSLERRSLLSNFSVNSESGLSISVMEDVLISLPIFSLEYSFDREQGTYSVSSEVSSEDHVLSGKYRIEQVEPWQGYFGEFPTSGKTRLVSSVSDPLTVAPSNPQSNEFQIKTADAEEPDFFVEWNESTEGAIWGYPGAYAGEGEKAEDATFRFLAPISVHDLDDFPAIGEITLLFSRPIADTYSGTFRIESANGESSVLARSTIAGNTFTITPIHPLPAGDEYSIGAYVFSQDEQYDASAWVSGITVREKNKIDINATNYFGQPNDVPTLSITGTLVDAPGTEFMWQDINEVGIAFSSADSSSTTISIPGSIMVETPVTVRATASGSRGNLGVAETQLIAFSGDESTQLGLIVEHSDSEVEIFRATNKDSYVSLYESFSRSGFNAMFWNDDIDVRVDLSAKDSSAIKPGTYDNVKPGTTNDAFREFSVAFQFESYTIDDASFTLHEIEFDANGSVTVLAFDFVGRSDYETFKGTIRHNSSIPLNE